MKDSISTHGMKEDATIGIIGAGKVGCSFGKYLTDAGVTVKGFYSKTLQSAAWAADFTETDFVESLQELVEASDTLFLTTPDGMLKSTWDCIAGYDLNGKTICHFSGSISSEIFSGIEKTGASGCSIHPMYAFSDKHTAYKQLHTACLTMEGQLPALQKMKKLFGEVLGHRIYTIKSEDKVKYHAAAAFASNYVVGIFEEAFSLLGECGFSEEDARTLLEPMAQNNIQTIMQTGTVNALTGPVERGDVETVQKHLQVMTGRMKIYKGVGKTLVKLAKKKNPERDYTVLSKIMD